MLSQELFPGLLIGQWSEHKPLIGWQEPGVISRGGVLANMCQIVLIRVAPSVTTYTTQELAQQIVTQFTCHKSQTVTNI